MRTLFFLICGLSAFSLMSQRNAKPKMAPIYAAGYYVTQRNDTVKGLIQTNLEDLTTFYKSFYFKTKGQTKARSINPQRAKAYGFGDQDFVQTIVEGKKGFFKRVVSGRLQLYEYKFHGKIDGYPAVVTDYYIEDSSPEESNAELGEPKKIARKFYKKMLKPYMSDQPMIWADLDKYEFDAVKVEKAIEEYNSFYAATSN